MKKDILKLLSKRNKSNFLKLILVANLLIIVLFLSNSCIKEKDFDMNRLASGTYQPTFAIPLAHSHLSMWDFLKDYDSLHLIEEDATKFLTLVYTGERKTDLGQNIFKLSDANFSTNETLNIPGAIPPSGFVFPEFTKLFQFNTPNGDENIEYIQLKEGHIDLQLTTNLNQNAEIKIIFYSILKNGIPIEQTINYTNGQPFVTSVVDLTNTTVRFESNSVVQNQIRLGYQVTVFNSGTPNNSPYNITIDQNFKNLKYSVLYGYLGHPKFSIQDDSIFVNIFSHHLLGELDFRFKEPKLIIDIRNSIGIPSYLDVKRLVTHSRTSDSIEIDIDSVTIASPPPNQIGTSALTHRVFANIDEAVNTSPQYLIYSLNPVFNPQGDIGQKNFITDTSNINIKAQLELPLWGSMQNMVLQDTFDFNFKNYKEVDWLELKFVAKNTFPIDAKIQVYFVDSLYNILDSAMQSNELLIEAGIPDPSTKIVRTPTTKITLSDKIENNTERIKRLEKTKYFFLTARLNTLRQNNVPEEVKIYSFYDIDMKIGLRVHLKKDFKLDE